ncbi:unnamed protein product, partial [Choristocarpus tenellus]
KLATVGDGGHFRIWHVQGRDTMATMTPITGLCEDLSLRDVAWLSADRLVLVAYENFVAVVSSKDVLQCWNGSSGGVGTQSKREYDHAIGDCIGDIRRSTSHRIKGRTLHSVVAHGGGFLVGASDGCILVFDQELGRDGNGGVAVQMKADGRGAGQLGRAVAKLLPNTLDLCQVLAGSSSGDIGFLDAGILFDNYTTNHRFNSGGKGGGRTDDRCRRGAKAVAASNTPGQSGEGGVLGDGIQLNDNRTDGSFAPTSSVGLGANPGEEQDLGRGFAKALDAFEASLGREANESKTMEGEGASTILVSGRKNGRDMDDSYRKCDVAGSHLCNSGGHTAFFEAPGGRKGANQGVNLAGVEGTRDGSWRGASKSMRSRVLFEPVVWGLGGVGEGCKEKQNMDRRTGGRGLTCLSLSTRKPLLAGIIPSVPAQLCVWNYQSKRLMVRHWFNDGVGVRKRGNDGGKVGQPDSDAECSVKDRDGKGSGDHGTGSAKIDGEDSVRPVAVSLHPSGDSVAVAFHDFVGFYYIVGIGVKLGVEGETGTAKFGKEEVDLDSLGNPSKDEGFHSMDMGSNEGEGAGDVGIPTDTLHCDQEFHIKGMFGVPGHKETFINYDPVSALHFSNGGHLLAVITGKAVQILGMYAGGFSGGRLGRVQTLTGHVADVNAFYWSQDDRRCWTAAEEYLIEWEVGSGMGALPQSHLHRGVFCSKSINFQDVVAGPGYDGGAVACCTPNVYRKKVGGSSNGGGGGIANDPADGRRGQRNNLVCREQGTLPPKASPLSSVPIHYPSSYIYVWPKKVEAIPKAGLEARVSEGYHITSLCATAFEGRVLAPPPRNLLLAGTTQGLALAFDWGCLLRRSSVGSDERAEKEEEVIPAAQVCLHSSPITSMVVTADGRHLFTSSADGSVFMCSLKV